jgi:hypothetical protein
MITFREYLIESLEPSRPIGKVKHTTFIKNTGTMLAKKIHNYNFTTSKGNKVDVQFRVDGEGVEDVVFYVNGRLSDDAKQGERDTEILSGVIYILLQRVKKANIHTLTLEAWKGEGDTKYIKGIDEGTLKDDLLNKLEDLKNRILNHKPMDKTPSDTLVNLYQRMNKPMPEVNKLNDRFLINIGRHIEQLNNGYPITKMGIEDDLHWLIIEGVLSKEEALGIISIAGGYEKAWRSNHDEVGYPVEKNRRQSIYKRIIDKYFSNGWDIEQVRNHFTLTRKAV